MKKLIIIGAVIALSACQYGCATIIHDHQLERLEKACKPHGGIQTVVANGNWSEAICEDGQRIHIRYVN